MDCGLSRRANRTISRPLLTYPSDDELALIVIVPHTTAARKNRWEFPISKSFLKSGVFHLQQIQPISLSKLERKLGALSPQELEELGSQIVRLLKLPTT